MKQDMMQTGFKPVSNQAG